MTKWVSIFLHSVFSLFRTRCDLAFENLLLRLELASALAGRSVILGGLFDIAAQVARCSAHRQAGDRHLLAPE